MKRLLITICGRAGSKGFKNKNLKNFCGRPLVYYSLSAAELFIKKHPELEIDVALNTDSEDLARLVAAEYPEVTYLPRGAELAVRIQGDSMEPHIHDGGVVYVNHDPLQNGDVGIFCVDGEMVCKQYYRDPLGMVYLFSLNRRRADADVLLPPSSGRSLTCFGRCMLHSLPLPQ